MLGDGRLPVLAEARERGTPVELNTDPAGIFPSAAYPTLYTGLDVGEHALYSAFPWVPAEQRVRYMHSLSLPESVWERLSPTRRSLVVDPYDHWRPRRLNGVCVNGWQYRNRVAALERFSVPKAAGRELERRFGPAPLVEDAYGAQPGRRLLALRPHLIDAPGRVAAAVTHWLARDRFDLVWATFSAGHFAGHFLWDTSQLARGGLSLGARGQLERTLEDVYEATDTALDSILAALPQHADVILLSPLGMGAFTSLADFLPDMLDAVLGGGAQKRGSPGSSMFRFRALVPSSVRAVVASVLPDAAVKEIAARLYLARVDWSRTRAVALPGERNGYVRLNVRGRERDGIVRPAEVDLLLDELTAGVSTFVDEDGHPAVESVERIDHGSGSRAPLLPDLVIRWADRPSADVQLLRSPGLGEVTREGKVGLSGHHREDGWAVLLPSGSRRAVLDGRPGLADVAATACELLGGDRSDLSGRPLLV
jgi:predicted AlkP superfamily phosphohydrolase/phosphomutase